MLGVFVAQVFAGLVLAGLFAAFLGWHALAGWARDTARVVRKGRRGQWTVTWWVGGALVVAFWSVGVLLLPEYAYHWPNLPDFPYSAVLQVIGYCIVLAGGALFFLAIRALGPHMTPVIQLREGHRLVQSGPYRYIRHPAYTAILTGGFGQALLYLSLPLALITLLLVALATYRAQVEEELLSSPEAFGAEYVSYASRTGRFLPRLRSRA